MESNKNQITKYDIIEFVRCLRTALRVCIIASSLFTPIGLVWDNIYILVFGSSCTMTIFAILYRKYTKGICIRLQILVIVNFLFTFSIIFSLEMLSKGLCFIAVVFGLFSMSVFLINKDCLRKYYSI